MKAIRALRRVRKRDLLHPSKMLLIRAVKPYSMVSYARLSRLYDAARLLERERVEGSIVECGVCNGGSAGLLAAAVRKGERHVWLFDSWQGLPEPTSEDVSYHGKEGKKGMDLGSEIRVRELLFGRLGLDESRTHLVKGWFDHTIPKAREMVGSISLLHLDCDWYESVRLCLDQLYDGVVGGGFVFIDDYGHWKGCKKAVDEFFRERNIHPKLHQLDYTGVYFRKPQN
ncbi:class I SAM-dependent methyltransferase [Candidatus Micrarchaeota archaeon]|nr:class I SAM-dependent methyltransferase [Candidatus Micrarchaeota archaeon]